MKYQFTIIVLLIMCFCVTACGENLNQDLGENFLAEYDYQSSFGSMPQIQRTRNGYYFLLDEYLYYYDDSLDEAVPVCDKVDCDHNRTDCNASMPGTAEINYYRNHFYYIASENNEGQNWYLYSLREDGGQREKIVQIATTEPADTGISFQLCVHRGMAYFTVSKGATLKKRKAVVNQYNLEDGGAVESVTFMEGIGASIDDLSAFGNTLVILGSYADSAEDEFHSHTDYVDIRTNQVKKDVLGTAENESSMFYKKQQTTYYTDCNYKYEMYTIDETNGKKKKISGKHKIYANSISNGIYIFSCNNRECRKRGTYDNYQIDVYNLNGKYISSIPLEKEMTWQYGDSDNLFVYKQEENGYAICKYDLAQLQNKNYKWEKILTKTE